MRGHFVLSYKTNELGVVVKVKDRLVADGTTQVANLDNDETVVAVTIEIISLYTTCKLSWTTHYTRDTNLCFPRDG